MYMSYSVSFLFFFLLSIEDYFADPDGDDAGRNPYNPARGYRFFLDQLQSAACLFCRHTTACPLCKKSQAFDIFVKEVWEQQTIPIIGGFIATTETEV